MPDPQRDRANMAWPRAPYRLDVMRDELLEGDVHETMPPAGNMRLLSRSCAETKRGT